VLERWKRPCAKSAATPAGNPYALAGGARGLSPARIPDLGSLSRPPGTHPGGCAIELGAAECEAPTRGPGCGPAAHHHSGRSREQPAPPRVVYALALAFTRRLLRPPATGPAAPSSPQAADGTMQRDPTWFTASRATRTGLKWSVQPSAARRVVRAVRGLRVRLRLQPPARGSRVASPPDGGARAHGQALRRREISQRQTAQYTESNRSCNLNAGPATEIFHVVPARCQEAAHIVKASQAARSTRKARRQRAIPRALRDGV